MLSASIRAKESAQFWRQSIPGHARPPQDGHSASCPALHSISAHALAYIHVALTLNLCDEKTLFALVSTVDSRASSMTVWTLFMVSKLKRRFSTHHSIYVLRKLGASGDCSYAVSFKTYLMSLRVSIRTVAEPMFALVTMTLGKQRALCWAAKLDTTGAA